MGIIKEVVGGWSRNQGGIWGQGENGDTFEWEVDICLGGGHNKKLSVFDAKQLIEGGG